MDCPKCDGELHEMNVDLVATDFCSGCKGVWFDSGEVGAWFELSQDFPESAQVVASPEPCRCPRCSAPMEQIRYAPPHDLVVDRCTSCDGAFFDRGEVLKLKKIATTLESPGKRLASVASFFKERGYEWVGVQST